MTIASINPATNQTLQTFTPLSEDAALNAVAQAHDAYGKWRQPAFRERQKVLLTFAAKLRQQTDEFARLIPLDMGKRISESRQEIQYSRDCRILCERRRDVPRQPTYGEREANAYIHFEPIGTCWASCRGTFPSTRLRGALPNIMAGNTVMVKHARNVPQCTKQSRNCLLRAGCPKAFTRIYSFLRRPSNRSSQTHECKAFH